MKAIILTGGMGLRLWPSIKDLPKPMAPIGGRPFLEYLILQLAKWQIREITLAIGYKGDIIKSFFGDGSQWGVKIDYSEEKELLGTGGALKQAIKLTDGPQFLLINGDSFIDLDFDRFASYHDGKKGIATISLVKVPDTRRSGKVEMNQEGRIIRFAEKNESAEGYINAGVYLFERDIIEDIPDGRVSLENDALPRLINKGIYGMAVNGFFIDIGLPEDYLSLNNNPDKLFLSLGIKT